jgi:hypothetical protein
MSGKRPTYASSASVRRAKDAIEKTGSAVRSVRLFPDGTIEIFIGSSSNDDVASEFDRLEAAGLL